MFTNIKQKNMKKLLVLLLIGLSFNGFSQQKELTWHTDVNQAIEFSVKQEKPMLMFFTGSDWCGWCKKLVKEVFVTPAFAKWSTDNIILVELDFPRRTQLPEETQKQNRELGSLFGVRGYPTIWFVNPEISGGKINFQKLGSQGYVRGGAEAWINGANKIIGNL
jgi:protein disulfide-isomerase